MPTSLHERWRAYINAPPRLKDDRGARRTVYSGHERWWSHESRQDLPDDEMRRIRRMLHKRYGGPSEWGWWIWRVCLVFAAIHLLDAWHNYTQAGFSQQTNLSITFAVLFGVSGVIGRQTYPVRNARAVRQILLEHTRCASCAYPLNDQPSQEDGCRVCPDCGAAWRLPEREPGPSRLNVANPDAWRAYTSS